MHDLNSHSGSESLASVRPETENIFYQFYIQKCCFVRTDGLGVGRLVDGCSDSEVEMVMLINQVTNTRKIQTAHPSRALTVILILIEISGSSKQL